MRTTIYTFCIAGAVMIAASSCEDVLNLEPAQSLSNESALTDPIGVQQTLLGAYNLMGQSSLLGGEVMLNADLYAGFGEIDWIGTFGSFLEIYNRDILINNAAVNDLWVDGYEVINTCNNVISAIDVLDAADQDRVHGEALAIRGWVLFELTRAFGQQYEVGTENTQLGVPIITEPTLAIGDNADVVRNTVEECYDQIIADLTTAVDLLPESNDQYINTYVASALLARVYLQKEDYIAARDAADRVIGSGDYGLLTNFADCFGQDDATDEDIFSVEVSELDGINDLNTYYAINDFGGRGDVEILDEHLALYDPADVRATMFLIDGGSRFSTKFNNQFANVSAIRLAEMYLIRAECNQRLGTATGATPEDDYNAVHTRAGLPAATSVSLDDILYERRLELAFEGFRVHDVKRTKGTIGTMDYNDPKMVYPIPQTEIERNPLLEQNTGY